MVLSPTEAMPSGVFDKAGAPLDSKLLTFLTLVDKNECFTWFGALDGAPHVDSQYLQPVLSAMRCAPGWMQIESKKARVRCVTEAPIFH